MLKIKVEKKEILDYHAEFPAGKLAIHITKPFSKPRDLVLAYTPGVSTVCEEIAANREKVFDYTAKGNLVAVISNGTAVLGLGNIGAEAAKPVMEGKATLFKRFAGIDAFDIELDAVDPDEIIRIIKALTPTFGAINLEDIKAPECFYIEQKLIEQTNVPIMHDDQHGTAVVAGAALLNALILANKDITQVQVVVHGAGAAAIATARLYLELGVKKENLIMCDRKGVIHLDRDDLSAIKIEFATDRPVYTLHQALLAADVFLGLSVGNVLIKEDLSKMAENPIVFALANPNPEIGYEEAKMARTDIIMATGRSDYPNQVNNVLAFPYIFRAALDVRATVINNAMRKAAVIAIASLAQEDVPIALRRYYDKEQLIFGKNYFIPKPLDYRLLYTVAKAVAQAAMDSGVAQQKITDWVSYEHLLERRVNYV